MTLYSLQAQRPAPLPFRITLPSGFTRTDPATFTADEITAAGFTGPYTEPTYDPATERLDWINGEYVISPLPPPEPTPDWPRFKAALLTNADANAALAAALPFAPGAVMTLPAALMSASQGETQDFRAAWLVLRRQGLIPQAILDGVTELALDCGLPSTFASFLGGQSPEAAPDPKPPDWNPPPNPNRGDTYQAPDGSWWRWDQPRDPATGQFLADDPATAEIESALDWQPFTP